MIEFLPDDERVTAQLYPLASVYPSKNLRVGILTIAEKWDYLLRTLAKDKTLRPTGEASVSDHPLQIPGNWIPTRNMVERMLQGEIPKPEMILNRPWQLLQWNDACIRQDFTILTQGRHSQPIPETVQVVKPTNVFIEEGAVLSHCFLNASEGPIYIARHAVIMEGAMIRGPFALGENSVVKMGTCIYGATTVGPHCIVGGEIKHAIFSGYSNKAHGGYMGDSIIGQWCNLGAGTTVSNLRNTAGPVKVWSALDNTYVEAGEKCGLLMGDFARSAILTAFNTGTVVGTGAHVFGNGLTPTHIRPFSWGMEGATSYLWEKVLRDMAEWKKKKGAQLHEEEIRQFDKIYQQFCC